MKNLSVVKGGCCATVCPSKKKKKCPTNNSKACYVTSECNEHNAVPVFQVNVASLLHVKVRERCLLPNLCLSWCVSLFYFPPLHSIWLSLFTFTYFQNPRGLLSCLRDTKKVCSTACKRNNLLAIIQQAGHMLVNEGRVKSNISLLNSVSLWFIHIQRLSLETQSQM